MNLDKTKRLLIKIHLGTHKKMDKRKLYFVMLINEIQFFYLKKMTILNLFIVISLTFIILQSVFFLN